jgi:hypothetical protein
MLLYILMETISKELRTIDSYIEERTRFVANATDLTMIFNHHATADDAMQTVAQIEPKSLVFTEGYRLEDPSTNVLNEYMNYLAGFHIIRGTRDPGYQELKAVVLELLDEQLDYHRQAEAASNDFQEHGFVRLKLLIEKDCIVKYADYHRFAGDEDINASYASFSNDLAHVGVPAYHHMDAHPNEAKTIRALYKTVKGQHMAHDLRESYALSTYIHTTHHFLQKMTSETDLALTPTGKVKTYLSYGTAHARSLTNVFDANGLTSTGVVLRDMRESRFLDESPMVFNQNIHRRVGSFALESLYRLSGIAENAATLEANLETIYEKFAPLNQDREATIKLLIQCCQIYSQIDKDPGRAAQWLSSLIEEVLEAK